MGETRYEFSGKLYEIRMPDEIYDVFDETGTKKIGEATWTECHTKGLLHKSVSVLIFKDATKRETLLQRRSFKMDQQPGKWQHSAGGHILAGDTVDEGIHKELQEELFFNHPLPPIELKKITTFLNHDIPNNYELLTLYEAVYHGPFYFDPKEVEEEPRWIGWNELLVDMKNNPEIYTPAFHNIMREYLKHLSSP